MMRFDRRLAKLETIIQPPDPPTIQVVFHRWDGPIEYGPIQAAPGGKWGGLQRLKVVYTNQWRNESEKLSEPR